MIKIPVHLLGLGGFSMEKEYFFGISNRFLKIRSIFLAESTALTALQCRTRRTEPSIINTIKTTKTTPLAF